MTHRQLLHSTANQALIDQRRAELCALSREGPHRIGLDVGGACAAAGGIELPVPHTPLAKAVTGDIAATAAPGFCMALSARPADITILPRRLFHA